MPTFAALLPLLNFLLQNIDLIEDVAHLVESGASKDTIRKVLRDLKVKVADSFVRDELGLPQVD